MKKIIIKISISKKSTKKEISIQITLIRLPIVN